MKIFWAVILTVIIMTGLAGGGYYYFQQKNDKDKAALQAQLDSSSKNSSVSESSNPNWSIFNNPEYLVTFKYPKAWQTSSEITTGEGTGTPELIIHFSQIGSTDKTNYYQNDIQMIMVPANNGNYTGFNEAYTSYIEQFAQATKSSTTIGGMAGYKYSNLGGLASNPEEYIVKKDNAYYFVLKNEKSIQSYVDNTTDQVISEILGSVRFSK